MRLWFNIITDIRGLKEYTHGLETKLVKGEMKNHLKGSFVASGQISRTRITHVMLGFVAADDEGKRLRYKMKDKDGIGFHPDGINRFWGPSSGQRDFTHQPTWKPWELSRSLFAKQTRGHALLPPPPPGSSQPNPLSPCQPVCKGGGGGGGGGWV